jgi:hypothetical protein
MARLFVNFEEVDGESVKHIDKFELSTTEFRLLNNFLRKYNHKPTQMRQILEGLD